MNVGDQSDSVQVHKEPFHEILLIVLQLIPYVGYLFLLESSLDKNTAADSFRYIWHDGSLLAFFTNSSLSVRLLYTLLGNNLELIASVQLLVVAISQVAIYRCIRGGRLTGDLILALILTVLFSSHNSRWLFNFAMSDSLFTSLYLLFIVTICFGDDEHTVKRKLFSCFLILLFVFSRNTAPYMALFSSVGVFMVKFLFKQKSYVITTVAIILSLVAIKTTKTFDTSTQLNAAQNIIIKVFPSGEKTAFFHSEYGMPVGPFVKSCKGGNVNALCFDYQRIQTGSTYTRNYRVTVDNYGFADWVREKGMQSWQHYLLVKDTANTLKGLVTGYRQKFSILFQVPPEEFWGKEYRTPLLPFDPFVELHELFMFLKSGNVFFLAVYISLALLCYLTTAMKRQFLFAGVLLVSRLALFFLGFFGDIGSNRQVYPAILTIYLGQILLGYFLVELLVVKIYRLTFGHLGNAASGNV